MTFWKSLGGLALVLGSTVALVACSDHDDEGHDAAAGSSDHSNHEGGSAGQAGAAGQAGGGAGGAGGSGAGMAGAAGQAGSGVGDAVTVSFEARVGSEAFSCSQVYAGLGSAQTTIEPLDFRLYVHDVQLVAADGTAVPLTLDDDGTWQSGGVALLDFEDKSGSCSNGTTETRTLLQGKAPAGAYTGLSFKVGVPFALNHQNNATAPSPLNLSTMFWGWNSGYKFVRIDGRAQGSAAPINLHLGSVGCQGDAQNEGVSSCANPNRPLITLTGFDPTKNKIVIDYAAIVSDTDLSKDGGGAPGCMSGPDDPECGAIFPRLGLDLANGQPLTTQSMFRVE